MTRIDYSRIITIEPDKRSGKPCIRGTRMSVTDVLEYLAGGMTQEELALHSGVTRNVLIDVEHGRRGLLYERLFDIANALGVPAAKLLKERQEPGSPRS